MRKLLLTAFCLTLFIPVSLADIAPENDDYECGKWDDVPDDYMDMLTDVCEFGVILGYNEDEFGYGEELSRAEAATIANRMAMGYVFESSAETSGNEEEVRAVHLDMYREIADKFTDVPAFTSDNFWIIRALYNASQDNIMRGDGNSYPTTFRPYDDINIVETFKIFYKSAYESDLISDEVENSDITFDGDPWWEELMSLMENEGVILHLDTDEQTFWLDGEITVAYRDFSSSVDREDAAIFLYYMIHRDLIDGLKLTNWMSSPL